VVWIVVGSPLLSASLPQAMGLQKLPSKSWTVNQGWVLAANIAADLDAWTRLLGLHDQPELARAEPDTLRYRILHLPAKLATHARRKILSIPGTRRTGAPDPHHEGQNGQPKRTTRRSTHSDGLRTTLRAWGAGDLLGTHQRYLSLA
jgi:Transposase DDE domain group 1